MHTLGNYFQLGKRQEQNMSQTKIEVVVQVDVQWKSSGTTNENQLFF
jgi:hypothetical protein